MKLIPRRYFYPDGQFYATVWRLVDEAGAIIACYASKIQAEEKLASLMGV